MEIHKHTYIEIILVYYHACTISVSIIRVVVNVFLGFDYIKFRGGFCEKLP